MEVFNDSLDFSLNHILLFLAADCDATVPFRV